MNDYCISPRDASASTPSLVLMMHLGGVDASMRDAAGQFRDAGFAVAVPDLYARFADAPPPDTANEMTYIPFAKQLTTDGIDTDIERAIAQLRASHPDAPIAIVGFCMGGRMAMVRSTGYRRWFKAAAIWYGFADDVDPSSVDIPVIGSFGGADEHIPADKVQSFFDRIPTDHGLRIYDGAKHGFFHKEAAYDAQAAADSLTRTVQFLHRHLSS